jgi:hypothetical protein
MAASRNAGDSRINQCSMFDTRYSMLDVHAEVAIIATGIAAGWLRRRKLASIAGLQVK